MKNPFRNKYYYIAVRKLDGDNVFYGALRNENGSYCRNETEASKVAMNLCKGRLFKLQESTHSTLAMATRELKAKKFEDKGNLEDSTKRVHHIIRNEEGEELFDTDQDL
jgi:hypothetical protein